MSPDTFVDTATAWGTDLQHLKLHDDGVAQHLDLMNEHMDAMTSEGLMSGDELYEFIQNSGEAVVSFSHFLPRCTGNPVYTFYCFAVVGTREWRYFSYLRILFVLQSAAVSG